MLGEIKGKKEAKLRQGLWQRGQGWASLLRETALAWQTIAVTVTHPFVSFHPFEVREQGFWGLLWETLSVCSGNSYKWGRGLSRLKKGKKTRSTMWSAKEPKLQALHHRWDWCCERGQRAPGNCWSMQSPQTLRRHNAVNLVIETLTASHKVWKTHCWRHLEQGLAEPFPGLPGWSFRIDRSTKPPALLPCKPLLVSICQARYIWPFVAGCLPRLYMWAHVSLGKGRCPWGLDAASSQSLLKERFSF